MKTNFRKDVLVSILIAICLTISACGPQQEIKAQVYTSGGIGDGNVLPVGLMTTLQYMMQVFRGDPGTFIMESPAGQFLFAAAMKGNRWLFIGVSADGTPISNILKSFCGSNCANTMTFTDLIKSLEKADWKYVFPSAVPTGITSAFGTATAFAIRYGNLLASPIPMIIVVPGGNFANPYNSGNG